MFQRMKQLSNTLGRGINAIDHLIEAGEVQCRLIRNISIADCTKKQLELDKEIADLKAQQALPL